MARSYPIPVETPVISIFLDLLFIQNASVVSNINEAIRVRRSVYPAQYIDKPIPNEILHTLLENANHAPTHRRTEPWRFKVFVGAAKEALGTFLSNKFKETIDATNEAKIKKIQSNCQCAGAVLAIVMHRDEKESVPEWEELASVSMAVQNIWLALDQYELGGYWSSPPLRNYLNEHVAMKENESCLGFFYIGYCKPLDQIIKKGAIEDKVEWVE